MYLYIKILKVFSSISIFLFFLVFFPCVLEQVRRGTMRIERVIYCAQAFLLQSMHQAAFTKTCSYGIMSRHLLQATTKFDNR